MKEFKKCNDGIELEIDKIKSNKTVYMIAKLLLNSLWGGWCKNPFKKKQKEITMSSAKFYQWLNDDSNEDKNFQFIHDRCMLLSSKKKDDFKKHDGKGNILHGAFTTGWARLILYDALDKLGSKVLYMDTDSVIFKRKLQEPIPLPMGDSLGLFTDEIEPCSKVEGGPKFQCFISEFVSGPKNYAYRVCYLNADGTRPSNEQLEVAYQKCVVRGFTLNKNDVVNFEEICRVVFDSKVWGDADDEMLQELLDFYAQDEKSVHRSKSGIVNIDPPQTSKFTIKIGDSRPITGVKRKRVHLEDGVEDSTISRKYLKTSFEDKFSLKPGILKRSYKAVIVKRALNWDTLYMHPFGYVN